MAYKVFIATGKGKNMATMGSIPLPNKMRVERYIRRNPMVKSNTKIQVTNTRTKKTITATKGRFTMNPFTKKYKY